MAEGNWTRVSEFILISFSSLPTEIQSLLFLTFLFIYLVTLLGNSLIILVTLADPMLHSPMYFFLRNLSFLEIGFNLVIVPKMLGTLIAQDTTISFLGCATQMYFLFFFGVSECFLLATMAYDRYVAICSPLHYPVIMNPRTCAKLAAVSWFPGIPMATSLTHHHSLQPYKLFPQASIKRLSGYSQTESWCNSKPGAALSELLVVRQTNSQTATEIKSAMQSAVPCCNSALQ
ncbi:PREDICTED: olfactory receptor 10A5-like [Bison bison bison]|uniref:Olfactory receptor n=1 Tax=Bison bison bison TaxID=43346 RepID=A0A6P3IX03_BISBB|nr:PREDICTED: olfactory receptor 10A5-like [Bison bison bison]